MKIQMMIFLQRWSAPNFCAGCLDLHQGSLVLLLDQDVPRLDVHLASDHSLEHAGWPLPGATQELVEASKYNPSLGLWPSIFARVSVLSPHWRLPGHWEGWKRFDSTPPTWTGSWWRCWGSWSWVVCGHLIKHLDVLGLRTKKTLIDVSIHRIKVHSFEDLKQVWFGLAAVIWSNF
jgi:hypothetical protein